MDFGLGVGSYLGIIIFLILTGAGLPLPEEVAIVSAGVLSKLGELDPRLALASCLFGAIVGDSLMYWIGYKLGLSWLRHHRWVSKFLHVEREKQMEKLIQKHGLKVFFLARFMVGVRGPIYLTAGILKVPYLRFLIVDAICATIVVTLFFGLSYYFGESVIQWIREGEIILTVAVLSIVVLVGFVFYVRHRRQIRRRQNQIPSENVDDSSTSETKTETISRVDSQNETTSSAEKPAIENSSEKKTNEQKTISQ